MAPSDRGKAPAKTLYAQVSKGLRAFVLRLCFDASFAMSVSPERGRGGQER
jgi:hypothetical protein